MTGWIGEEKMKTNPVMTCHVRKRRRQDTYTPYNNIHEVHTHTHTAHIILHAPRVILHPGPGQKAQRRAHCVPCFTFALDGTPPSIWGGRDRDRWIEDGRTERTGPPRPRSVGTRGVDGWMDGWMDGWRDGGTVGVGIIPGRQGRFAPRRTTHFFLLFWHWQVTRH